MKALHPLSRSALIVCERHETASRVLRLALYPNWCEPLGRVLIEPILFNISDSRTLRRTGLHVIGSIFGEAVEENFYGRNVILVVRQESGSTPVPMDSWLRNVELKYGPLSSPLFDGSVTRVCVSPSGALGLSKRWSKQGGRLLNGVYHPPLAYYTTKITVRCFDWLTGGSIRAQARREFISTRAQHKWVAPMVIGPRNLHGFSMRHLPTISFGLNGPIGSITVQGCSSAGLIWVLIDLMRISLFMFRGKAFIPTHKNKGTHTRAMSSVKIEVQPISID